jgi:hypothetical protein
VKNYLVDSDHINSNAFQDSDAYKGEDEATQKCIDLAGKIGGKLGDQKIIHCSEDPNFTKTKCLIIKTTATTTIPTMIRMLLKMILITLKTGSWPIKIQ